MNTDNPTRRGPHVSTDLVLAGIALGLIGGAAVFGGLLDGIAFGSGFALGVAWLAATWVRA